MAAAVCTPFAALPSRDCFKSIRHTAPTRSLGMRSVLAFLGCHARFRTLTGFSFSNGASFAR